jgi:hypothetical protein
MIYTVVFEEIVYDDENMRYSKKFSAEREEQLPFAPTQGQSIAFSLMGLEMGGEYHVEDVLWDCVSKKFYCFSQRPLKDEKEVDTASRFMGKAGWTISHWEPEPERSLSSVREASDLRSVEQCAAGILAALQGKKIMSSKKSAGCIRLALRLAVSGLLAEIRPEGNSQPGESAIESLRSIYGIVVTEAKREWL